VIRAHRRDETWSASLCQTFFVICVGAQIPASAELPPSVCGCKKFSLDDLGDHVSMLELPRPTREVKRPIGQLRNLLTYVAQHIG